MTSGEVRRKPVKKSKRHHDSPERRATRSGPAGAGGFLTSFSDCGGSQPPRFISTCMALAATSSRARGRGCNAVEAPPKAGAGSIAVARTPGTKSPAIDGVTARRDGSPSHIFYSRKGLWVGIPHEARIAGR